MPDGRNSGTDETRPMTSTTWRSSTLFLLAVSIAACGGAAAATTGTITPTTSTSGAPALNALPLGDGKVSTSPRVGYVYSCQTTFGGGGANGATPWITGSSWDLTAK